jgi:monothiol glutaredoxin
MDQPSAAPRVQQIAAAELKAMMDRDETFELIDVRTEFERSLAAIDGSELLDDTVHERLLALDRSTPLVFVCHHGMRSQAAADYFLRVGFRNVHNVVGGIDAWSAEVDPSVPRY